MVGVVAGGWQPGGEGVAAGGGRTGVAAGVCSWRVQLGVADERWGGGEGTGGGSGRWEVGGGRWEVGGGRWWELGVGSWELWCVVVGGVVARYGVSGCQDNDIEYLSAREHDTWRRR